MPGSQVAGLGEWLDEREDPPIKPIPPVEAALRAAGAHTDPWLGLVSGARASICTVFICKVSIALTGGAVLDAFPRMVKEESKRSA